MLISRQILVTTFILGVSAVGLSACGQQGALYLPAEPAAKHRATLPQTIFRSGTPAPTQPQQPQAEPPLKSDPSAISAPAPTSSAP